MRLRIYQTLASAAFSVFSWAVKKAYWPSAYPPAILVPEWTSLHGCKLRIVSRGPLVHLEKLRKEGWSVSFDVAALSLKAKELHQERVELRKAICDMRSALLDESLTAEERRDEFQKQFLRAFPECSEMVKEEW